ncbi:MAG TPA: hypothetical protein VLH08_21900 [Acidobacteriota bacterium]|nr:hypothetical protein [Acidobacteriota bacterium]
MSSVYLERVGRFVLFPVIHHSFEFAQAARVAFDQVHPVAVGIEYPFILQNLVLQAVRRLPRISILLYGQHYLRIEPVDAFVEIARCGIESNIPVRCIDLHLPDYPQFIDPVPDTYAVRKLGHERYCKEFLNRFKAPKSEQDQQREYAMAFHLQELDKSIHKSGDILVATGLAHIHGLKAALQIPAMRPFEHKTSAKLYHLSSSSLGEIMGTFPFLSAVYELQRNGPVEFVEEEETPKQTLTRTQPLLLYKGDKPASLDEFVKKSHQRCAAKVPDGDRNEILARYIHECRAYYEQEIGDQLSPQQMMLIHQFLRKYAAIKQMLLPDFYELLIGGRGCVNSHFCYRMWEIGTSYPVQQGASEIEIIELRAEDLFALVSKVRMNPHAPLKPRATLPRFLRRKDKQSRKPREGFEFDPFTICSHQPEDLIIENYGNYLRSKGKNMLSDEKKRVRPFETSLLDGIDLRETIRNWHTGQIFVQECMTVKGEISSLVVIFDEEQEKYPYTMTWLGEHHQESDMAFYATEPEERQVGPGIRKSIYGGYLMTMPPGRLFDIFGDPAYMGTLNHAERLLMAGIDYSLEKFVVYAAAKPPRPVFQILAGRYGKRILYIPLSQLSPVMVQRIRSFHILSSKSVRDYASDYIW